MTKKPDAARIEELARAMSREPSRSAPAAKDKAVRTTPVRITTDLGPQLYKELTEFSQEAAISAGRARVPHSEVIRALIQQLRDDAELRNTIITTIKTS